MSPKISAVVCAYNEEKTLKHVLNTLTKTPLLTEIICVDDGSTDKTFDIASQFKSVKIIRLKKNRGKGYAMVKGIKSAHAEIIIFIDADLSKLTSMHIKKLLKPILKDNYEAVMGFPMEFILDPLFINVGGQRVYKKKDLLPLLTDMEKSKYGVEILLNTKLKNLKTKNVALNNLGHLNKAQKRYGKEFINEIIRWTKEIILEILKQNGLTKDKIMLTKVRQIVSFEQAIDITNKLKEIDVFQRLNQYILKTQYQIITKTLAKPNFKVKKNRSRQKA